MTDNRLTTPLAYGEFCTTVRLLCAIFDASETSGARTRAHNRAVGGADSSKHQLAFGAFARDLVCDDATRHEQLAEAARRCGLYAKVAVDHVHVQGRRPGRLVGWEAHAPA